MSIQWIRPQVVLRLGALSWRVPRRSLVVSAVLVVLALVLAVVALGLGEYRVPAGQVLSVLVGRDDSFARVAVLEWRMPRVVGALAVGAALGLSGAIFQALTSNALGSPDVIGFTTGAYTGALVVIASVGTHYYATAGGALVGGFVAAAAVFGLSLQRGSIGGVRLVVVGIAVSAVLSSFNQWLVLRIDVHRATSAAIWAQGTLNGIEWEQVVPLLVGVGLLVVALLAMGSPLSVLQLGDDAASALGLRLARVRIVLFGLGVACVAITVAVAGPISFVALAAPQIARRLTAGAGLSLTTSAVTGASLLLASDVLAQRVLAPTVLPVGAVTICLGGGYLVWLLVSRGRRRTT